MRTRTTSFSPWSWSSRRDGSYHLFLQACRSYLSIHLLKAANNVCFSRQCCSYLEDGSLGISFGDEDHHHIRQSQLNFGPTYYCEPKLQVRNSSPATTAGASFDTLPSLHTLAGTNASYCFCKACHPHRLTCKHEIHKYRRSIPRISTHEASEASSSSNQRGGGRSSVNKLLTLFDTHRVTFDER